MRGNLLSKAQDARLTAVIIRADGRVENLGTIAYWHKNPLRRWAWKINRYLKDRLNGR